MFNYAGLTTQFRSKRVTNGLGNGDGDSHVTLFAGPDPADRARILIRKLIQVSDKTYCYEETRVTPAGKQPVVHTQVHRLKDFDLKEKLSPQEIQIRGAFRPLPNVMGFSLYYKRMAQRGLHLSIVENTLFKTTGSTWTEWFQDMKDRRDISSYMRQRWVMN